MNIFQRIFGRVKPPAAETNRAEIIGGGNSFSAWSGNAYSNDIYRGAVDAIARNAAKLKGSHVIKYRDHERAEGDCKLNRILQIEPNPYMSAFDMLYKPILSVALEVRELLYQIIQTRRGKWERAFVITTIADTREMKAVADELRAEVVLMETTLEECIRRIQSDPSRAHNRTLNEKLAAEWFEKYNASLCGGAIPPTPIF